MTAEELKRRVDELAEELEVEHRRAMAGIEWGRTGGLARGLMGAVRENEAWRRVARRALLETTGEGRQR